MPTSPQDGSRSETSCPNCEAVLQGGWCHACGQKRIGDEERRLSWLLRDFAGKVASLDGKLFRSLLVLMLQPGRLGAEWLSGKRIRWMAPMALFLLVNVIYFVAQPVTDFNLPLHTQLRGQGYSDLAVALVDRRVPGVAEWIESAGALAAPEGYAPFASKFDQRAPSLSKALLILQVPLVALALLLLHWRRRIHFVDHFAIALHFWTFMLIALIAIGGLARVGERWLVNTGWFTRENDASMVFKWTLLALLLSHLVLMLRRAYGQSLPIALVKALPVFGACVVSHFLFRGFLFAATYYSI